MNAEQLLFKGGPQQKINFGYFCLSSRKFKQEEGGGKKTFWSTEKKQISKNESKSQNCKLTVTKVFNKLS